MTLTQSLVRVALATAFLLLIPLVAMQFTAEVNWTFLDFVFAGFLLFGAGTTFTLLARMGNTGTYRAAVGVAVLAGLLLVWANAAVGLVGSEDNPFNLLYGAVLGVAVTGAIAARFRARGMANTMFAAALTYLVVTALALFVWPPVAGTEEPTAYFANVLVANGVFASLWAIAGGLFRRASATGPLVSY